MSRALTSAPDASMRPSLDVQLRRYHRSYRRRLRKIARSDDRLKDLLYTFPAAAFALAGGHGNPLLRAEANRLVRAGESLRGVGTALGFPKWLQRLPPEAFIEPVGPVPDGAAFVRQISNVIPLEADHCARWLQWVLRGSTWCDEDFGLWIARQRIWDECAANAQVVQPLAVYAWFSRAEGSTARGLIERSWTRDISFAKAVEAAQGWFIRCLSDYCGDDQGVSGRWFVTQRCSGFRIVPLRTAEALTDEGNRMDHCVGGYTSQVMMGACLIYSVRRGNDSVATFEVRPQWDGNGQPTLVQLRGPENNDVGVDVTNAVQRWLQRQGRYPFAGGGQLARMPFNEQRWAQLWGPFLEAKGARVRSINPLEFHRALENLSQLV